MELPEVTEIQRLTLKSGDRLILKVKERLPQATAAMLREQARARLRLPDDVPLVVLDSGMSLDVLNAEEGA